MMDSDDGDNDASASSATIATTNSNGINGKDIDDDHEDEKKKNKNESLPLPIPKPLESTTTIVTATTTKGKGLKKWRRIQRRDFAKDEEEEEAESGSSSSIDPNRILKRDLRSDNSEDPSSNKSSTAATIIAPIKFRSHRSTSSNRSSSSVKNTNNNAFGSFSSSSQRPSRIEPTKKLRGSARIDKDASYSSVESDLRSSAATANVFFTENISNGKHISYDVDNSSEAQASDQQSNDYVHTIYFKDNGEEEVSQDDDAGEASWEAKEEQCESQRRSASQDLLAESILSLQAVHEALEKEIQHFGEIGKEPILLFDDTADQFLLKREFQSVISEIHETKSSGPALFEEIKKDASLPLEAEVINIQSKVRFLERKLEEATTNLETKESRIVELEGILNEWELPKEEPGSSLQSLQEKCRDMETELDDLFKQKIEAEVECLAMRKTSQKLKIASEDQIALFEEQKTIIGEQHNLLHKFRDTESKIATTKEQVDKLASFGESLGTDEVLKMHSRIRKHTLCCSVQLTLLCLVVGMLFLQSWPGSTGYAPT